MKVTAISDLHGNLIDIEPCDVLLICGDISPLDIQKDHLKMTKWIFNEFQTWIMMLPCVKVILTPGNHDFWFEKMINTSKTYLFNKLIILINDLATVYVNDKWYRIYGTPYCKQFGSWAYMTKDHDELVEIYDKIPEDLDILITHEASDFAEIGCTHLDDGTVIPYHCYALTEAIRKKKPKYALCGHIHSGNHNMTACPLYKYNFTEETTDSWSTVNVANCSILDESYSIYYKPTTFEI